MIKTVYVLQLKLFSGDDPWIAHVFLTDGTESFYKCASTIISKRAVLTSMSCVMMEGRLMNPSEFEIQVARFVISRPSLYTRTYEVKYYYFKVVNFYIDFQGSKYYRS